MLLKDPDFQEYVTTVKLYTLTNIDWRYMKQKLTELNRRNLNSVFLLIYRLFRLKILRKLQA